VERARRRLHRVPVDAAANARGPNAVCNVRLDFLKKNPEWSFQITLNYKAIVIDFLVNYFFFWFSVYLFFGFLFIYFFFGFILTLPHISRKGLV
jgi:hypothetical protein